MIRPYLPLNGLRAFEAAARHLSFTKAAIELCVTPPALSHPRPRAPHRTAHGSGAVNEGPGDAGQHDAIVYPAKRLGELLMSNSDNAESIFGHLLALTIADTFTPLEWENYASYDRAR